MVSIEEKLLRSLLEMYQMSIFFQSCCTVILLISVYIRKYFLPRTTSTNLGTAQEPPEFKFL